MRDRRAWYSAGEVLRALRVLAALALLAAAPAARAQVEGSFHVGYGWLRLGAHVLYSPPAMNDSPTGGSVVTGALTLGFGG